LVLHFRVGSVRAMKDEIRVRARFTECLADACQVGEERRHGGADVLRNAIFEDGPHARARGAYPVENDEPAVLGFASLRAFLLGCPVIMLPGIASRVGFGSARAEGVVVAADRDLVVLREDARAVTKASIGRACAELGA